MKRAVDQTEFVHRPDDRFWSAQSDTYRPRRLQRIKYWFVRWKYYFCGESHTHLSHLLSSTLGDLPKHTYGTLWYSYMAGNLGDYNPVATKKTPKPNKLDELQARVLGVEAELRTRRDKFYEYEAEVRSLNANISDLERQLQKIAKRGIFRRIIRGIRGFFGAI